MTTKIITISTETLRRKARRPNAGQFTTTVLLTEDLKNEVRASTQSIRKGQWVMDGATGQRGQYIRNKVSKGQVVLAVRAAKPGLKFADYQKKLAA